MKLLAKRLMKYGDGLEQVKRTESAALYSRTSPSGEKSFEVWVIRKKGARSVFGRDYPAEEVAPSPSEWGSAGWTYLNTPRGRADADAKFQECSAVAARKAIPASLPSKTSATPSVANTPLKAGSVPAIAAEASLQDEQSQFEFGFALESSPHEQHVGSGSGQNPTGGYLK
jgi:hypothetical protein